MQELFTRKDPFHCLTSVGAIITGIVRGSPDRPSTDDTCARMTDEWWDLCTNCWEYDPVSRPTMPCIIQTITKIVRSPSVAMSLVAYLSLQMNMSSIPHGVKD